MSNTKHLISIIGPTAIGKTNLAIALSKKYSAPILSSDSRQFYREMCIGTAVPSKEELAAAAHFFIQHKESQTKQKWASNIFLACFFNGVQHKTLKKTAADLQCLVVFLIYHRYDCFRWQLVKPAPPFFIVPFMNLCKYHSTEHCSLTL